MSLQQAILIATEAVRLDQAGKFKQCMPFYIDACTELLAVIKAERDPLKQMALKKRMHTYMSRAEVGSG